VLVSEKGYWLDQQRGGALLTLGFHGTNELSRLQAARRSGRTLLVEGKRGWQPESEVGEEM
jgi:hypothetical protein